MNGTQSQPSTVAAAPTALTDTEGSYNYSGGNRIITDYTSDKSVALNAAVTGIEVSGNNLVITSADGALTLSEVRDKVMSFTDANGNIVAYAYMASEGGTVDGRGLSAFEVIIGANNANDLLMASGSGSSLYGGKGSGDDTLQGGAGPDTFLHTNGTTHITNFTTGDTVNYGAEDYQGFSFYNENNIILYTSEGTLNIENSLGEVVELADGNGNFVCHVFRAAGEGEIDGRLVSGYEVIGGANHQSNVIRAGNEGSSIFGGLGGYDTLIGGDGADCFMAGMNAGIDEIFNAYSNDYVNLMDTSLSDITGLSITAGATKITMASGAELTVHDYNGVGYQIGGQMYDANIESNSFVARS
ncbi:MAG: hypothetical protein IJS29_07575 [Selenomonadaceae bacterium]|nr:hypothetical protein [Selenomonadaceae bacterium]